MPNHEDKTCERCNTPFECKAGNITQCQCNAIQLSPQERTYIALKYTDCLCADCLVALKLEMDEKHKSQ